MIIAPYFWIVSCEALFHLLFEKGFLKIVLRLAEKWRVSKIALF